MSKRIFALTTAVFVFATLIVYPTATYAFLGLPCLVCKIKKKPSTPSVTNFTNNDIYNLVSEIYSNQQALLQTQSAGKQIISDPKIQAMIQSAILMLQQGANEQEQAGLNAFVQNANQPGSVAYQFRSDLKTMIGDLMATSSEVLSYANSAGPSLQLQNSGALSLIDQIPPALLFPLYLAMSKIGIIDQYGNVDPNVMQYFEQGPSTFETLKSIENPTTTVAPTTATVTNSASSTNSLGLVCTSVLNHEKLAKGARDFLKGAGVFYQIVGTVFEAFSKTILSPANAVDGGVGGWVDVQVKQNDFHLVGTLFKGLGDKLSGISSFISNQLTTCGMEQTQQTILANEDKIQANEATIQSNQQAILSMLCEHDHHAPICAQYDTDDNDHHNEDRYSHHG